MGEDKMRTKSDIQIRVYGLDTVEVIIRVQNIEQAKKIANLIEEQTS
jgi:hypothetical protein